MDKVRSRTLDPPCLSLTLRSIMPCLALRSMVECGIDTMIGVGPVGDLLPVVLSSSSFYLVLETKYCCVSEGDELS